MQPWQRSRKGTKNEHSLQLRKCSSMMPNPEISYICPLYFSLFTRQAKPVGYPLVRMRFAGSIPAISSQTQSEMTGFLLCLAAKLQDLVPRASFEGIAAFFVLIYHKSHHNPGMFQVFPSTICTRKRTITNYITKSRPYRWLPTSFGPHLAGCGCSGSSQMCREGDGGKNMSVSQ